MFGKRLRELRTAHNLTQVQMADLFRISKQSIANWERGNIMPSVEMLVQIADYFLVTVDYLLGRTETGYLKAEDITPDQRAFVQQMIRLFQQLNEKG